VAVQLAIGTTVREESSRARTLARVEADRMKGAEFAEDSVVELVELGVMVEVEIGEFPASIEVSRVATDRNWDVGTVLAASDEDAEKGMEEEVEEEVEEVEENVEENMDVIKTVERSEDGADVVIVSTALLKDEAGIVAPEERVSLVTNGVEVSGDECTAVVDKDRSSDDTVVAIVRTAVETLSVEAEAAVVDVSTTDCVEVDAPEVTAVCARDEEAVTELDMEGDVLVPLLMAFPIKVSISRPGLIANTMPS
jgi:hypothetical protein